MKAEQIGGRERRFKNPHNSRWSVFAKRLRNRAIRRTSQEEIPHIKYAGWAF